MLPTLPLNSELQSASRLRGVISSGAHAGVRDWACLVTAGVSAAVVSTFLDFNLRIPGHAILRAAFPIALGLALVPRRGAGCVMSGTALLTALSFRFGGVAGHGLSLGAITSLTVVGPCLDWSLRNPKTGWRQYAAFGLAGLAANFAAFAVRGSAKAVGLEHAGARPLAVWLPTAAVTYTACGLLAGLIGGVVLFYGRNDDPATTEEAS